MKIPGHPRPDFSTPPDLMRESDHFREEMEAFVSKARQNLDEKMAAAGRQPAPRAMPHIEIDPHTLVMTMHIDTVPIER